MECLGFRGEQGLIGCYIKGFGFRDSKWDLQDFGEGCIGCKGGDATVGASCLRRGGCLGLGIRVQGLRV